MTDMLTSSGLRTNGAGPTSRNPSGLAARRRWSRVALGVALVLVWIWGTVAAVMSAGERTDVLAVASDVDRYEEIERSDLRVVRIGVDEEADTVAASRLDDLVGRVAAVDLVAGSVLAPGQLVDEGERVVGAGEALVGAQLKPGEFPPEGARAGSAVLVVVRPTPGAGGGGSAGGPTEVEGWLLSVGDADEATGQRSVSLVVPRSAAPAVTAAAADGRVSLVVLDG
jgi:hypothetical protein